MTFKDLESLADLLDSKFKIVGFRFGLDGLIGLIPGIGDLVTSLISLYIVFRAFMAGAPFAVILRMLFNIFVEYLVGLVPVLGNLFDFIWRSNLKNINLMRSYGVDPKKTKRKATGLVFGFVVLLVFLFSMLLFLSIKVIYLLVGLF